MASCINPFLWEWLSSPLCSAVPLHRLRQARSMQEAHLSEFVGAQNPMKLDHKVWGNPKR